VPAIISQQVFGAVKKRLQQNIEQDGATTNTNIYWASA
jgi:hypothetical protein